MGGASTHCSMISSGNLAKAGWGVCSSTTARTAGLFSMLDRETGSILTVSLSLKEQRRGRERLGLVSLTFGAGGRRRGDVGQTDELTGL